ncbi:g-type lectin s-receptor-like serine/threonine-protein kinase lecrk2 [Quercus suber]|uniref:G-type lectin s-receptor-like serine/threonine-protein kinase lecrk2 n=1 Tax=Quercus suber TaxID=58331 RepID=A0AAW0M3W8_QUESU
MEVVSKWQGVEADLTYPAHYPSLLLIAIWCIQEDPSLRPTMKKVVQMMEGSVEVSVPPGPSSFISSM